MFTDEALRRALCDMEFEIPTIDLRVLVDERPDLASRASPMGYPLHDACMRGLPLEVIQVLLEAYPSALSSNVSDELDLYRQSPVFVACSRVEPHFETIDFLIEADRTCLKGAQGRPPLYHYCMGIWNQPKAVWSKLVQFVYSKDPSVRDILDTHGRHPVHYALSSSDTDRFQSLLQSLPPESLVDAEGNHVLHLAVANTHCVPKNLTCVLEHCPEAVRLTNQHGELPIHRSTKKRDRLRLLQLHPYSLLQATKDDRTVLGNVRRELNRCLHVYFADGDEVMDVVTDDEQESSDEEGSESRSPSRQSKWTWEWDWEFPIVSWVFPTNPTIALEWDEIMEILRTKVISPLEEDLDEACLIATGRGLPLGLSRQILRYAIPHYDEALYHTKSWPPITR